MALPLALLTAATQTPLESIVAAQALAFNVSISFAAVLANGSVLAAASGPDDRAKGTSVTTASLYPSGSVTKTITATACMRLADAGKLELDAPVHTIVDPWLAAQGMPSLLKVWKGDATVERVTVAQLLQMRSGLSDYDDAATRDWQIAHPTRDILPEDFIANASKRFLFQPGDGGSYTGIGYVLLGWVLCASVDGCKSWADLDLKALVVPPSSGLLEQTRFMRAGPCSQYPKVVHQYLFDPQSHAARAPALRINGSAAPPPLPSRREAALFSSRRLGAGSPPSHCKPHTAGIWFDRTVLTGPSVGERNTTSGDAAACCAAADGFAGAMFWSFLPTGGSSADSSASSAGSSGVSAGGTCRFFAATAELKGEHSPTATSGRADPPVHAEDFLDLYDMSCLNGWTMGDIATTPSEIAGFYHGLFGGRVVSPSALQRMTSWATLTTGFAKGTPYGYGLMQSQITIPLRGVHTCGALPACKCFFFVCSFSSPNVGHAGLDYGSGMQLIGHLSALNVSFAMASNAGEASMGMNFSLGYLENAMAVQLGACGLLDAVVHAAYPSYPPFACQGAKVEARGELDRVTS